MKRTPRTHVLGTLVLCAVCAAAAPRAAARQTGADAVALEVGKPVERELKGGETHAYSLRLEAGQFVRAVVEQKGVDVVVRLFDPSGAKIAEVDSPNGANGPEPLAWATPAAGLYRIEVEALDPAAAGRYEIRALEVRAATETERKLIEPRALEARAAALANERKYDEATPLAERALTLYEQALGPDDPELATPLKNLAEMYRDRAQYEKAEPLLIRAIAIREKASPDSTDTADAVNDLAVLYNEWGRYAKAEPLYVRSLAITEKALGPDHPTVSSLLMNLAFVYADMGLFAKAEPLLIRSIAIREKALPDSSELADSVNNLGSLYDEMGQYAKAEPLYLRSLAIKEKAIGPESSGVASSLVNLAFLYAETGQNEKVEPLFLRGLAVYEKVYGADNLRIALTLNNLATFYRDTGQYAKAEPLYLRAIAFYEKAFGPEHPRLALALHNLAKLYAAMGQLAKAEPLSLRALAIREKQLAPDHPDIAASLGSLATLYRDAGQYAKAEPLYERSLAISEKALGPDNPDVARTLNDVAVLHLAESDLPGALRYRARAGEAREGEIRRNLTAGSAQAKRLYLAQTRSETDLTLTIQAASAPTDADALRVALTQVLRRKGRALDALVDQLDVLARSGSPEDRKLLDDLARARADLAALTLRRPGKEGVEQHRTDLAAAAARVDALEAKASTQSTRARAELSPITLDAVRAAVPSGATLVEFATYNPYDAKARTYGATRYVVYTLATEGTVRWADLGPAAPIEAAVAALREALRADDDGKLAGVASVVKPRARALDALVFAPVRELVGTSTRLLIAPDGQLSLVPFDALVDERGRYATERFEISYLTSGRDLLRLAARGASRQPSAIIANPDFGVSKDGASGERLMVVESKSQSSATTAEVLARAYFPPLPGTEAEAEALPRLLPDARVLTGDAATKQALTSLSGPRVLHLATHGFFLAGAPPAAGSRGAEVAPSPNAEDPLLRSGLAFAGANRHEGGDAILTALEAAGLDLWGTKLVVLSACDTGVGEVRNGDGVYGLRRALMLAGSETQMMSLWPVSDQGTRELMIGYYRRLASGEGRSAAMRAVRLAMLKSPKLRHPYYWASFIVSGEWAPLDGERRSGRNRERSDRLPPGAQRRVDVDACPSPTFAALGSQPVAALPVP